MATLLYSPLSLLPSCPSIHQIKQAHALITTFGLSAQGTTMGHPLAAFDISSSSYPPSSTSSEYPITIFNQIEHPNIFASNNMIRCLAKTETPLDSFLLYKSTYQNNKTQPQPNNYTFPFLLQACSKALGFYEGSQVHAHIVKLGFNEDVFIQNSFIHFYSACQKTEDSRKVLDESPQCRDIVTWNAILASYARD